MQLQQNSKAELQRLQGEHQAELEAFQRESQAVIQQLQQDKQAGLATLRNKVQEMVSQIKRAAEDEVARGLAKFERQVSGCEESRILLGREYVALMHYCARSFSGSGSTEIAGPPWEASQHA